MFQHCGPDLGTNPGPEAKLLAQGNVFKVKGPDDKVGEDSGKIPEVKAPEVKFLPLKVPEVKVRKAEGILGFAFYVCKAEASLHLCILDTDDQVWHFD